MSEANTRWELVESARAALAGNEERVLFDEYLLLACLQFMDTEAAQKAIAATLRDVESMMAIRGRLRKKGAPK